MLLQYLFALCERRSDNNFTPLPIQITSVFKNNLEAYLIVGIIWKVVLDKIICDILIQTLIRWTELEKYKPVTKKKKKKIKNSLKAFWIVIYLWMVVLHTHTHIHPHTPLHTPTCTHTHKKKENKKERKKYSCLVQTITGQIDLEYGHVKSTSFLKNYAKFTFLNIFFLLSKGSMDFKWNAPFYSPYKWLRMLVLTRSEHFLLSSLSSFSRLSHDTRCCVTSTSCNRKNKQIQNQLGLAYIRIKNVSLRGYCTNDRFCGCLCTFLKNNSTLVTDKICFLKVTVQGTQFSVRCCSEQFYWVLL